jgi:signal transduction histidine kinase
VLVNQRADQAVALIDRRTDAYVEKLYSVRGAFVAAGRVLDQSEFHDAVASQEISRRYPGIQVLSFATIVGPGGRAELTRRTRAGVRESGLPYAPFSIRPPGAREQSAVITHQEPQIGNEAAFGFDLLSDPSRSRAIRTATTTGRAVATAPVRLVTDVDEGRGFLLVLPLYADAQQRGADVVGIVLAAFNARRMLRGVLGEQADVDLTILDDAAGVPLYDARPGPPEGHARTMQLSTAGRSWQITYATDAQVLSAAERALPWVVAALGLLVSLLAAGLVQQALTARRQALALVAERTADLARSNRDLEQFAVVASHDLQQPLRTVAGYLDLLEHQEGEALTERGRDHVDRARAGSRQMAALVEDLLAYARAGRETPTGPVDLDTAWDAAVRQLEGTIRETGAEVARGPLPTVRGDAGQFTQVFANLIGNALKYRSETAPRVHAEAVEEDGVWEVSVSDNGIGIDPSDHDRVFQMFRRVNGHGSAEGTGVGLAIVKRIVERSGGRVALESERGRGTRFVMRLPA